MGRALGADRTCCLHTLRLLSATGYRDLLPFEDQVTGVLSTRGKPGHLARRYLVNKMHCAELRDSNDRNQTATWSENQNFG